MSGILASRLQALVQSPLHSRQSEVIASGCFASLYYRLKTCQLRRGRLRSAAAVGRCRKGRGCRKVGPILAQERDVARLCGKDGDQAVEVQDLANAPLPIEIRSAHEGLCPTHLGRPSRRDAEQSSHAAATMVSGYGFHHVWIFLGRLGLRALG